METPFDGMIDRGDVFQVNPDFSETIGWSLVIASRVYSWGIDAALVTDVEALWFNNFKIHKTVAIGWENLEFLGHIKLGHEYENTDYEKEREICNC